MTPIKALHRNGLGRRVAITETSGGTSTTTSYLWCGSNICSAYSSGGTTTARYLSEGEVRYSGGTATNYYYETDHLGTVTSMTSATGATLGTLATDAYGNTLSSSGTLPTFGYAGMFLHQPSGLYLTENRAYDPYSGRWLSRDPAGEFSADPDDSSDWPTAGGDLASDLSPAFDFFQSDDDSSLDDTTGLNLYGYVSENPIDYLDPSGLGKGKGGGGGKGERGQTKSPGGTPTPDKHWKPDPNNPGYGTQKDSHTGKSTYKKKPPYMQCQVPQSNDGSGDNSSDPSSPPPWLVPAVGIGIGTALLLEMAN